MKIEKFQFINNGKKFTPKDLFKNGEQGVWYDPSDIKNYMATGPNLVLNSDFSDGLTNWAVFNATAVVNNGIVTITNTGVWGLITQSIPTIIGKRYIVEFEIIEPGNGISVIPFNTSDGIGYYYPQLPGIYRLIFTASSTITSIRLVAGANIGDNGSFNFVTTKELINVTNATMFQDITGTIPVTGVEQPVGLILDKSKNLLLGNELIPNGDFSTTTNWSTPAGWVISGGVCTATTTVASLKYSSVCTAGRFYIVEFDWTHTAGTLYVRVGTGPAITFTTSGRKRVILMANDTNGFEAYGGAVSGMLDNVSVRELKGNHAYQTTAIDRPILMNRYNLLTKTEVFTDTAWGKATSNGTAVPVVTGDYATDPLGGNTADRIQLTLPGDTEWSLVRQVGALATIPPNVSVTASLWIKATDITQVGKYINLYAYNVTAASYAIGNIVGKFQLTSEWQRVESSFSFSVQSNSQEFSIGKARSTINNGLLNSDTATDFLVWGAQFVFESQKNIPYQRVDIATIYDSDYSKFPVYLACNGTNTWMRTNNMSFSATDEINIFAGIRKMQDSSRAMVAELGNANQYAFRMEAPLATNVGSIAYASGGSTGAFKEVSGFNSPISVVATGISKISTDLCKININNTPFASVTTDQGTGNYGTYPLYLFRRTGTSLPFNGNFYGLIIRGKLSTDKQIKDCEKYLTKRLG